MPTAPSQVAAGLLAGMCSGVTKLLIGHPFDTIKLRLQTLPGLYPSPWACCVRMWREEGVRGYYKGASPPLLGWMVLDSVGMGSLHYYQACLRTALGGQELTPLHHGVAGLGAGLTVSLVGSPIEMLKGTLQIQHDDARRTYTGPLHLARQLLQGHGVLGLYKGFTGCLVFRSLFSVLWASYEVRVDRFMCAAACCSPLPRECCLHCFQPAHRTHAPSHTCTRSTPRRAGGPGPPGRCGNGVGGG
jgi:solute carrier family 25 carnitine/acylcarnitine transporter 20/29